MAIAMRGALLGLVGLLSLVGTAFGEMTVPVGSTVTVPGGGGLDLGCLALTIQGNVVVGGGQISQAAPLDIATTGVLDGGSGNIGVGGNWNNAGTFIPGSGTVVISNGCGSAQVQLTGNTVFNNLTLTSTNGGIFVIPTGHSITVNGRLTLQGVPGQSIRLISSSGQTAYVTLGPGAQVVPLYAMVQADVQIGAGTGGAQGIPTLGEYGLLILALLLGGSAAIQGRAGQSLKTCRMVRIETQGESHDATR